jgi:YVTN family beta-propeller protein
MKSALFTILAPVENQPIGIAIDQAANRVYVANYGSDSISVIDGRTYRTIENFTLGYAPWGLGFDNLTKWLYVANPNNSAVTVIDTVTNHIVGVSTLRKEIL